MNRATIMSISLYDATVTNYLQTLNSTAAVLDKGKVFVRKTALIYQRSSKPA